VTVCITINSKTDINVPLYPLHSLIILDQHQATYFILIFTLLLFIIVLKVIRYIGYIVHNKMQTKYKDYNLRLLPVSLILLIIP
jgi:hypothetical protein